LAGVIAIRLLWMALFQLWNDASGSSFAAATFRSVKVVLSLCLARVDVDPAIRRIGSPSFHITVDAACSGVEGLSLILVLTVAWLWFFRREFRFPRALLLIPAASAVMWVSNVVRIAALILIGNAGYPDIAIKGFHSVAGWIAFTGISLAFLVTAQHLPWLSAPSAALPADVPTRNPTAAYLVPFVTIMLAAMVSGAASAGFEWLYPLRFIACVIALWSFRSEYRALAWRVSWFSPVVGALVFVLWIGFDRWMGGGSNRPIGAALAAMPALSRFAWLAFRIMAAVITVPLAEELAFRGYGARRLMAVDFESVSFRELALFPIAVSSLIFGILHGGHWIAGTLAGAAYALALRQRGRIGDAVAAHATTNALLAAWVMTTGSWRLW
jgi:exosortase E/protease (VPEID-CTERM system)